MAAKKKKIAIVGFAASSVGEAPFKDKTWVIWGLNELWRALPKREDDTQAWDVWFDIHPRWSYERRPGHVAWMKKEPKGGRPIYMQEHFKDIPASVPVPLDTLLKEFGPYFTCGPAFMLAMAILEKPSQIGIWGIDMLHDTEYAYQRPCVDYFIGVARGRGIPVYIPDTSSLAKSSKIYGYDGLGPRRRRYVSSRVKKRQDQIQEQRDNALRALYSMDGALETIEQFGIRDDLIKMMADEMAKTATVPTDKQSAAMRMTLERYRAGLLKLVSEQREQALQVMYSLDGSMQELGYWADVAKHLERRGV